MSAALALLLALSAAASGLDKALPPERPEDMGPAVIDVSGYPAEQQETYHKIFLPVYGFLRGGPARAINSPLVTSDEWRREVARVKNRPPCCGACPIITREDALKLWKFFTYDSERRKTGANAAAWAEHRRKLQEQFNAVLKEGPKP